MKRKKRGGGMKRRGLIDPRVLSLVAELVMEILRAWAAHLSFIFFSFLSLFSLFVPVPCQPKKKKCKSGHLIRGIP